MASAEHHSFAKLAFQVFWDTFGGMPVPIFDEASDEEKHAWEASAEAVYLATITIRTSPPVAP